MQEAAHPLLAGWDTFYVILGSSAAALTGLQFVVMALIADAPGQSSPEAVAAFGTPTVVHFCLVLFVSAVLAAPWPTLGVTSLPLGACGVGGLIYVLMVLRRASRQTRYKPVLEDWLWHGILPLAAYGALFGGAVALTRNPATSLFVIGTASLLLVFIGIHNAWDSVAYITTQQPPRHNG